MKQIILASSNAGKIAELQALLDPIVCISQDTLGIESVEETGLSFVENALLKARNASKRGLGPALADDSGLVVPCLRGEPGIYSARYAGLDSCDADNNALLLSKLKACFDEPIDAYFYCAIVVLQHAQDPTPLIATGLWQGQITASPMGEAGFGYDPLFYLPEFGCTAAQLPRAIKNKISHRAQALSQLKESLRS